MSKRMPSGSTENSWIHDLVRAVNLLRLLDARHPVSSASEGNVVGDAAAEEEPMWTDRMAIVETMLRDVYERIVNRDKTGVRFEKLMDGAHPEALAATVDWLELLVATADSAALATTDTHSGVAEFDGRMQSAIFDVPEA